MVEGFYGPPWSHDARLYVTSFVAERGMNAYLYAPKDDAKHRRRWRESYDAAEHADFVALARHCERIGMTFGFAISPGLDIDYDSPTDRATLLAKLRPLADAGIGWFLLALDDIPLAAGLAARQAALTTWLDHELRALRPDVRLALCPTEYLGTRPSQYLADLGAALPADVDVMWTGPTVCSPRITAPQAEAWADAVGGRPPLLWDNFPVNDGPMAPALHLGPYRGRDPDLADALTGVLCNPMSQAAASQIGLATAAEFLSDPDGYEAGSAWERAIADVGGPQAAPLRALARACASSPLNSPADVPAARLVEAIATATAAGKVAAIDALEADLTAARDLTAAFPAPEPPTLPTPTPPEHGAPDRGTDTAGDSGIGGASPAWHSTAALAAELAPWAEAAEREARLGLCATALLHLLDDAPGEVPAAVAQPLLHAAFLLIAAWDDARRRSDRIVYGPRLAVHPALVPLPDGSAGIDMGLAVTEDASAIDRLCRLAVAGYGKWACLPAAQA